MNNNWLVYSNGDAETYAGPFSPITGNGRGRCLAFTFGPFTVPKVTEIHKEEKRGKKEENKGESMKGKRMRRDEKGTQLTEVLNNLVKNFNDPIIQREAAGVVSTMLASESIHFF